MGFPAKVWLAGTGKLRGLGACRRARQRCQHFSPLCVSSLSGLTLFLWALILPLTSPSVECRLGNIDRHVRLGDHTGEEDISNLSGTTSVAGS